MVEDVKIYLEEKYFTFLIKGFMDNTTEYIDKHAFDNVKETITSEKLDVIAIVFGLYYFRSILLLFFLLLYSNYC